VVGFEKPKLFGFRLLQGKKGMAKEAVSEEAQSSKPKAQSFEICSKSF
jgi:hypothetical protein